MQYPAPRRRLVPLVVGAVAALAACADTTGHDGEPFVSLSLRPVLPAPVSSGAFDLAVDRARIQLIRPPAEAVIDTVVVFPPEANQLSVRLRVRFSSERLAVRLELRSQTTLLFVGLDTIDVRQGSVAPSIPLAYVGPGSEVTAVRIEPRDTALRLGDQFTFGVSALFGNTPVERFYVGWSTSDPGLASVDAHGTLKAPTGRGKVFLRVVTPSGVKDSTTISFSPPAQTLTMVGGDGQTGFAGQPLEEPFEVRVLAGDQLGVPGVRVRFRGLSGGHGRDSVVITDDLGYARTVGILGPVAGPQVFEASVAGLSSITFLSTALIGAAARIEAFGGNGQIDTVGRILRTPFIARVTDLAGNPVAGVTVTWQVITGGGSLDQSSGVTNLSGIAFTDYVLGPTPGLNIVRASMSNPPAFVDFVASAVTASAGALQILSGDAQSDTAGATLAPFRVLVTDAFGNRVTGGRVRWNEVQGGGLLTPEISVSNQNGVASTIYRLPTAAGTAHVVADLPDIPVGVPPVKVVFGATVLAATPINLALSSGNGQTAAPSTALAPFAVRVTDRFGNPVPGAQVQWNVMAGGGSLSAAATTADLSGIARVIYTLGPSPGANTVRAMLASGATVFFNATAQ